MTIRHCVILLVCVSLGLIVSSQASATWVTSGSDQSGGYPGGLIDGDLNTYGMKDKWNQSIFIVRGYNDWKVIKALKIYCADAPGEKPYEITVESSDSLDGACNNSDHFMRLVHRERIPSDEFVELSFTTRKAKAFKVTIRCLTGSKNVRVKELEFVEIDEGGPSAYVRRSRANWIKPERPFRGQRNDDAMRQPDHPRVT